MKKNNEENMNNEIITPEEITSMEKIISPEEEKRLAFAEQQMVMQEIYQQGFSEHIKSLADLGDNFNLEKHQLNPESGICVCCMDERTPRGKHAAGSGMLLSDEELDDFVKEAQPDSFSSHDGCGAAKLYCKKYGLPLEKSDEIAKEWAKEKADKYGKKYFHIPFSEMIGSKEFHSARVAYFDNTGIFNYDRKDKSLPQGFMINRRDLKKESALEEIKVALNIIFGDHGLKDLLTPENPFVMVAIASNQEELEQLKTELTGIEYQFGDRVKIDGFVKPE
jgi:hypothetical protein